MDKPKERGMTFIVKMVTKLVLWFIFLYGIYISVSGHVAPGGGFAGGVIMALALIQALLAFGKDAVMARLRKGTLRLLAGVSAIFFLFLIAVPAGRRIPGSMLVIPVFEMVVVGCGLFVIFAALVLIGKHDRDSE